VLNSVLAAVISCINDRASVSSRHLIAQIRGTECSYFLNFFNLRIYLIVFCQTPCSAFYKFYLIRGSALLKFSVTFLSVKPSGHPKTKDEPSQESGWYLFNDYQVLPISQYEAVHIDHKWKVCLPLPLPLPLVLPPIPHSFLTSSPHLLTSPPHLLTSSPSPPLPLLLTSSLHLPHQSTSQVPCMLYYTQVQSTTTKPIPPIINPLGDRPFYCEKPLSK
jgi:hypothetical protein